MLGIKTEADVTLASELSRYLPFLRQNYAIKTHCVQNKIRSKRPKIPSKITVSVLEIMLSFCNKNV